MENDDQHAGIPWDDNGIKQNKALFLKNAHKFLDLYGVSEMRKEEHSDSNELVEFVQWKDEELNEDYEVLRAMWPNRDTFSGVVENGFTYINSSFKFLHFLHKVNHPDGQTTIIRYLFETNENAPEHATYTLAQTREQEAIKEQRKKEAKEANRFFFNQPRGTRIPFAFYLDWMNRIVLQGWQKMENQNSWR